MRGLRLATVVTAALFLGACGLLADGEARKDLAKLKPSGTTFNSYLAQEYLELSTYEEKVEFDWQDSDKWAKKGLAAAARTSSARLRMPSMMRSWSLRLMPRFCRRLLLRTVSSVTRIGIRQLN